MNALENFPDRLHIKCLEEARSILGPLGATVPHRDSDVRRTADHRDWWCVRRWLLTALHWREIEAPITLNRYPHHEPGADFSIRTQKLQFGLEITEATVEEDQRERAALAKKGLSTALQGGFGGRSYANFTNDEIIDEYLNIIDKSINRKIKKIPRYLIKDSNLNLLLYINNNVGVHFRIYENYKILIKFLSDRLLEDSRLESISKIFVLESAYMVSADRENGRIGVITE